MKNSQKFDVLVVYSGSTASSANRTSNTTTQPFSIPAGLENYNTAYAYFLNRCKKQGMTAALSTTSDVIGPGKCNSYWLYKNKSWEKNSDTCYSSHIFDKFSQKSASLRTAYKTCFSLESIRPFNSTYLSKLFGDKLKTYTELIEHTIPTVTLQTENSISVLDSINELKKLVASHPNNVDFSKTIIMKDRFGSEGNAIYKISKNFVETIQLILMNNKHVSFILQPYVHFDKGFSYKKNTAATDIRLIFQNNKIIQTYIRMAKKNDFRCNQHQGGTLLYTSISDIPSKVKVIAKKINTYLGQKSSLFALDFIVSNSGAVYFLEGNNGPGIIWDLNFKEDEYMAKQLIHGIVDEFAVRVGRT